MSVFVKRDRFPKSFLPYVKLDYIQGTGTQYIDTGYKPNNNTRILVMADAPKRQGTPTYVLGVNEWIKGQYCQIRITSTGTAYINDFGGQSGKTTGVTPNGKMLFDKNKNFLTIGDVTIENTDSNFQCTANLKLLAGVNTSGNHIVSQGKIYSCQIHDNDILVRDFIPVQMKKSGEIGLWDKVNEVFYGNAGTGYFVGMRCASVLNYIQSTGVQYINTNYYPKYNTRLIMETSDITTNQGFIFGTRDSNAGTSPAQFNLYRESATSLRSDYFGTAKALTISDTTAKTTIDKNANITTCFGSTITNTAVTKGQCSYPLFLFALNNVGSPLLYGFYKLYSCKIYEGDVLVHDYIPYCDKNGNIGLLDKIQQTFVSNSGTDMFLTGGIAV